MKKSFLMALVPLVLGIASCGGNQPASSSDAYPALDYKVEYEEKQGGHGLITDAIGRKVDIVPGSYSKVVCIGAGALRLYSYVGSSDLLAGVEDIDNPTAAGRPKMFDNAARPYFMAGKEIFSTLPSCGVGGPSAQTAEPTKILQCEPDIVISEYEDVEKEDALQEQVGVPVIALRMGSGGMVNSSLYGSLAILGKVFGKENRAKQLIEYHYESQKTVYERTRNVTNRKKAYICGLGAWGTTNQFYTAQNYDGFNIAHIDNVVVDLPKDGIQPIEEEKFLSLAGQMDTMFFDAAAVKNIKGKGFDFSPCKAFTTGEVYLQMPYNAYYTNVETALINVWFLAKSVYPELFTDVNIETKADEITVRFNGKALYAEMKKPAQSYGGYQKIANPTEFFQ